LRDVLEELKKKNLPGAIAHIKKDSGNVIMDQLKLSIADLTGHEEELLEKRNSRLPTIYAVNDTIHYASFVLILRYFRACVKNFVGQRKVRTMNYSPLYARETRILKSRYMNEPLSLEKKGNLTEKLNRDLQDNFEELQSFYEGFTYQQRKIERYFKRSKRSLLTTLHADIILLMSMD
jgi:hypothetical protein